MEEIPFGDGVSLALDALLNDRLALLCGRWFIYGTAELATGWAGPAYRGSMREVEPGNDLPAPRVVCVRGFARQPPDTR